MSDIDYAKIHKEILEGGNVVFLGGAGVSTASGIPDFRSEAGLYHIKSKYGVPYEEMLSHHYFYENTENFYDFYWSTMVNKDAKPNLAHLALARFEKEHPDKHLAIITQNIDGLHQKAGSKRIYEAHGSVMNYHCLGCHKHYTLDELEPHGVPKCSCGGLLKPDVVLYEEGLDEDVIENALIAMSRATTLIIGGTSMAVYPVASFPNYFHGSRTIIINLSPTPYDRYCDYVIREDVGKALSLILLGE